MKIPYFILIGFLFTLSHAGFSQSYRWELLGTRKVDYKLDRDILPVTARKDSFRALKLVVKHGGLNLHKCVVHFENGAKEEIAVRHNFLKRSSSRTIDLPGNKRFIEKIEFYYDSKNRSRHRAEILVYGGR